MRLQMVNTDDKTTKSNDGLSILDYRISLVSKYIVNHGQFVVRDILYTD